MFKTLYIYLSLKVTSLINGIIYYLNKLPLIKNLIKDNFYDNFSLKIVAAVISLVFLLSKTVASKALYFFTLIYLPLSLVGDVTLTNIFHLFLFLTIVGGLISTKLFNPTTDKYYGVILLKMNAKEYMLVDYLVYFVSLCAGYIGALLFLKEYYEISFLSEGNNFLILGLSLPIITFIIKNIFNAYKLYRCSKTGEIKNENVISIKSWIFVIGTLLLAYLSIYFDYIIPLDITTGIYVLILIFNIKAINIITDFNDYKHVIKEMYSSGITNVNLKTEQSLMMKNSYSKKIDNTLSITSDKKGYAYFNDLFIKRHSKMLTKFSKKVTIILVVIFILLLLLVIYVPELDEFINNTINNGLAGFIIIMYFLNKGGNITSVMFMNSDYSMLSYNFYKTKDAILNLFLLRVKSITLINLIPASVIAVSLPVMMYLTGGTPNIANYFILPLAIISLSLFFSVHYLVLYYIFQPFNKELKIKSPVYYVITVATYYVCFLVMDYTGDIIFVGLFIIIFTVIYLVIGMLLAYKFSPKTFKNK